MTFATEPNHTDHPTGMRVASQQTALENILAGLHQHLRLYPTAAETPDYPWGEEAEALEDQDIELLWAWLIEAERASAAARLLRARIEAVMLVDIKRNGAVKLGDLLYRKAPKTGSKWAFDGASRRLIDYLFEPLRQGRVSKATKAALDKAADIIDGAFGIAPRNVRVTYLDAVAAERAVHDADRQAEDIPLTDDEIKASQYAVRDTFIARDRDTADGYSLSKVPAKRQPKWALRMTHGERKQI